jgi:hypothetical protein
LGKYQNLGESHSLDSSAHKKSHPEGWLFLNFEFDELEGKSYTKVDPHAWSQLGEELILSTVGTEDKFALVIE